MPAFKPQTLVRVLPAYRMGGHYEPTGHEGIYTVLGTEGRDVLLAPGDVREMRLPSADWELAVRETRIRPLG